MKIGIICAMREEADIIIKDYKLIRNEDNHFEVYESKDKELFLIISKIGKIYATMGAKRLLMTYKVDLIINIGLAGGLKKEFKVGNVYFGEKIIQHDVYLPWKGEHLDYLKGEIYILNELERLKKLGIKGNTATILTGDQFINDKKKAKELSKIGDIVEMEAFAVASVCSVFKRDLIIIKAISDNATEKAPDSFEENLKKAMKNSMPVLKKVIAVLQK